MAKLHLAFRNIHAAVKTAAEKLFDARPFQAEDDTKHTLFQAFLNRASAAYDVPSPALEFVEFTGSGLAPWGYEDGVITLGRYSVTTLFIAFRFHLQAMGMVPGASAFDHDLQDAQKYAYSLFYAVRPRLFRKAVRANRIFGMHPADLLADPSTWVPEPSAEMAPVNVPPSPEVQAHAERVATTENAPALTDRDGLLAAYRATLSGSTATVNRKVGVAERFYDYCKGYDEFPSVARVEGWLLSQDLTESSAATYRGPAKAFARYVEGLAQ